MRTAILSPLLADRLSTDHGQSSRIWTSLQGWSRQGIFDWVRLTSVDIIRNAQDLRRWPGLRILCTLQTGRLCGKGIPSAPKPPDYCHFGIGALKQKGEGWVFLTGGVRGDLPTIELQNLLLLFTKRLQVHCAWLTLHYIGPYAQCVV